MAQINMGSTAEAWADAARPPTIAVVGAGAIGSAVAYSLAAAGFAPKLVARGDGLAAIRRDGLRVDKWDGRGGVAQLEASDEPRSFGPQDLVIGTMKAQDWPGALPGFGAWKIRGHSDPHISDLSIIGLADISLQKTARTARNG